MMVRSAPWHNPAWQKSENIANVILAKLKGISDTLSADEQDIDEQDIDEQDIDEQDIDEQDIDEQNIDGQNTSNYYTWRAFSNDIFDNEILQKIYNFFNEGSVHNAYSCFKERYITFWVPLLKSKKRSLFTEKELKAFFLYVVDSYMDDFRNKNVEPAFDAFLNQKKKLQGSDIAYIEKEGDYVFSFMDEFYTPISVDHFQHLLSFLRAPSFEQLRDLLSVYYKDLFSNVVPTLRSSCILMAKQEYGENLSIPESQKALDGKVANFSDFIAGHFGSQKQARLKQYQEEFPDVKLNVQFSRNRYLAGYSIDIYMKEYLTNDLFNLVLNDISGVGTEVDYNQFLFHYAASLFRLSDPDAPKRSIVMDKTPKELTSYELLREVVRKAVYKRIDDDLKEEYNKWKQKNQKRLQRKNLWVDTQKPPTQLTSSLPSDTEPDKYVPSDTGPDKYVPPILLKISDGDSAFLNELLQQYRKIWVISIYLLRRHCSSSRVEQKWINQLSGEGVVVSYEKLSETDTSSVTTSGDIQIVLEQPVDENRKTNLKKFEALELLLEKKPLDVEKLASTLYELCSLCGLVAKEGEEKDILDNFQVFMRANRSVIRKLVEVLQVYYLNDCPLMMGNTVRKMGENRGIQYFRMKLNCGYRLPFSKDKEEGVDGKNKKFIEKGGILTHNAYDQLRKDLWMFG